MTLALTGRDLTLADVVAVARDGAQVALAEAALEAMNEASALADHIFERGLPIYGLTTGLGAQKRTSLRRDDDSFSRRQIAESHVGQGRSRRPTWCARRCSSWPTSSPGIHLRAPPPRRDAGQRAQPRRVPRGQVAGLSRRLGPCADGRHRARALRRRGAGAGRGPCADQLQRLRDRVGGARARRRGSVCWTPPTSRRRSRWRASPRTSRAAPGGRPGAPRPGAGRIAGASSTVCSRAATSGRRARLGTCRTR